jgi:uncharacterized protein
MNPRFVRYELRTTDVDAAEIFYADVLPSPASIAITRLPERAAANGAPPHWLGHIGVGDVDEHVRRFVSRGAAVLGPEQRDIEGARFQVVRHPLGAIVALSSRTEARGAAVGWHQLLTTDSDAAWTTYAEPFGWTARDRWDLGADIGAQLTFSWDSAGPAVGGIADTAARNPQTHVHWLFAFEVGDFDAALARVWSGGGNAMTPLHLPNGSRVVACHDPRGAAFGLHETAPSAAT